jgi:hypothetical protein
VKGVPAETLGMTTQWIEDVSAETCIHRSIVNEQPPSRP